MGMCKSKEKAVQPPPAAATAEDKTPAKPSGPDYIFKFLIVGDISVGKSNLLFRYLKDKFFGDGLPTIQSEPYEKDIILNGTNIRLKVFDTAGQEKFNQVTASFFRSADACLLCFDLTRKETLQNVETWIQRIETQAFATVQKVLIACKSDMEDTRQCSSDDCKAFAEKYKIAKYIETSAKDGKGVDDAFETAASMALEHQKTKS